MNGISLNRVLLLFVFFTFVVPVTAKDKKAGVTLLTRGSVVSQRSTKRVKLKRRSSIFEKDIIRVGNNGRAQFRMIDRAIISLQENSILKIKNYQYQAGASNNSALLELVSGGLRTITGAIGKGNKKAYELRTPMATIGIRGTDYEVEIVSNGMYVGVWDGTIILNSLFKGGCKMLVGRSQPFMFAFIDRSGKCNGLRKVPKVFETGHSSNVSDQKTVDISKGIVGNEKISGRAISLVQDVTTTKLVDKTFTYSGFYIDQAHPTKINVVKSTSIKSSTPVFKVGLDFYSLAKLGSYSNFKQSIGGLPVSWGRWNKVSNNPSETANLGLNDFIWTAYDQTDPSAVIAKTGTFRYENVTDSLLSSSVGTVNNLRVQMDVNFESGNVTNGALSANTKTDTWVAVFDGKITSGDLDLQLNGASVINSNPSTPSSPRDASGFISGDFVGDKAEAIIGGFGLSEDAKPSNHIEGVFLVK